MAAITGLALDIATSLSIPTEILYVLAGIGIMAVATLATWLYLGVMFGMYADMFATYDQSVFIRTQLVGVGLLNMLMAFPRGIFNSAKTFMSEPPTEIVRLVVVLVLALLCVFINSQGPAITDTIVRVRQCYIMPVVNDLPLLLLNVARILYDVLMPLANIVIEIYAFLTNGVQKILKQCTIKGDPRGIFEAMSDMAHAFALAVAGWAGGGVFTAEIELTHTFYLAGQVFFKARGPLSCLCYVLDPVWELLTGLLQIGELHLALNAAANAVLRLIQWVFTSLINMETQEITPVFDHLIVFSTMACTFIQRGVLDIVMFLRDLLDMIEDLINNAEHEEAGQAGDSPRDSLSVQASIIRASLGDYASVVSTAGVRVSNRRRIVVSDLVHAVRRTTASPLTWDGTPGKVHAATPLWDMSAAATPALRPNQPIWEIDMGSSLSDILGLPILIAFLSTQWGRVASQPVNAALVIVNTTLNVVLRLPFVDLNPSIIAYFQFGWVFEYLARTGTALADITVLFDQNLPCVIDRFIYAIVYYCHFMLEIIVIVIIAAIWPRWVPGPYDPNSDCYIAHGEPGYPTNCTEANKNKDTPPGREWTIFDIFPDYYDWEHNALREADRYFMQDATCIAVLLGCNGTTIEADDCIDKPFQCVLRKSMHIGTEIFNLTSTFVFYIPDIVQFKASHYRTFMDLHLTILHNQAMQLVECFTGWYSSLSLSLSFI